MKRAPLKGLLAVVLALAVGASLSLAVTGCGCSKSETDEVVTEETGERVTVNAGQHFTLAFPANQSTGYVWHLKAPWDSDMVRYVGRDYVEPSDPGMEGAMGEEVWQFQALAEGGASLLFEYARPGDDQARPAKLHTVELTINRNTNVMNHSINVEAGRVFELSLESDQGVGAWAMTSSPDPRVIRQVGWEYFAPTSTTAGREVWRFKGEAAGTTSMVLEFFKTGDPVSQRTGNVGVTVTKAPAPPAPAPPAPTPPAPTPPAPAPPREYRDQNVPIDAAVGEVFIIILPVEEGTGYQWQILEPIDAEILMLLGEEFLQPEGGEVGRPGAYYFTFQAKGKGTARLYFGLIPPDEEQVIDERVFTVNVR